MNLPKWYWWALFVFAAAWLAKAIVDGDVFFIVVWAGLTVMAVVVAVIRSQNRDGRRGAKDLAS